ncbi:hypothetical protein [Prevotella sp. oral taxon 820]|uniref:hypothetical protein n=1 Tax=Prevotella sp. oral taxon 820 TaxID=2081962 RepID=UPI001304828B|nr:hypothetical protein [Prevotella sp. oral taxon 820]
MKKLAKWFLPHGGNTVFRIFVVSPMAEMQISAISGFPPQRENKKGESRLRL